ncbi:MAG: hypothetical protein J5585_06010 [Clostridia bacterium]|nr:hypothetical protein [Clostridia bacterium]
MKKVIALVIAALMLAVLCVPATAANNANHYVDWEGLNADESKWIVGSWVVSDTALTKLGYSIDGGDVVWTDLAIGEKETTPLYTKEDEKNDVFRARDLEQTLKDAWLTNLNNGEEVFGYRVYLAIDVSGLGKGEHSIQLAGKYADGTEGTVFRSIINTFNKTKDAAAPAEQPSASAAELLNKSWDNIYTDGQQLTNGSSNVWLETNEVKGSISEIELRGWAHISTTISGFAYSIDGGKAVKSADFIQDRQDVKDAIHADANGFDMKIDVSNVGKGAHTIKIYAVDANGELVDTTFELPFTQEKEATKPTPETGDAAVIAIAAVACVALAGVVISKKVR